MYIKYKFNIKEPNMKYNMLWDCPFSETIWCSEWFVLLVENADATEMFYIQLIGITITVAD